MHRLHGERAIAPTVFLLALTLLDARSAVARTPDLRVTLKFVPTDAEEAVQTRGVVSVAGPAFEIVPALDARPGPHDLIGESRGRRPRDPNSPTSLTSKVDVPIRATSDVATWITQTLSDTFRGWGTPSTPGADLVLQTEIARLFVVEMDTYEAEVSLRVSLKRRDGNSLWTGIVGGAASRFGRTMKAENYQEVLSDAVFSCYMKLWADPGFRQAWAGNADSRQAQAAAATAKPAPSETLDPEVALKKVLELKEAGFEDDVMIAWVKKIAFTRPMTSDDMLAWKRAGVPQAVIKAAME